jgi:DNA polymerase III subunit epsilon
VTTWRDASFAVVDVETTGLDACTDEVLSIGIVPVDEGRIRVGSCWYREIRPDRAPTSETIVIHGILPSQASSAPERDVVGREVVTHLADRVLVAHVADIEQGFLSAWLGELGWRPPALIIDTDVLTRRWLADTRGLQMDQHVGLGAAAGLFGLPEQRRHHALGDALTTAQLFLALASRIEDGHLSAKDLARRRSRPSRWGHPFRRP